MKLKNDIELKGFLDTVDSCKGSVWLESLEGDKYNINSTLTRHYLAIGKLVAERGDELELFCQLPEDERKFYEFFDKYPGVN